MSDPLLTVRKAPRRLAMEVLACVQMPPPQIATSGTDRRNTQRGWLRMAEGLSKVCELFQVASEVQGTVSTVPEGDGVDPQCFVSMV